MAATYKRWVGHWRKLDPHHAREALARVEALRQRGNVSDTEARDVTHKSGLPGWSKTRLDRVALLLRARAQTAFEAHASEVGPARPPSSFLPGATPHQRGLWGLGRIGRQIGEGTHATLWEVEGGKERNLAVRVVRASEAGNFELRALEASQGLPFFPRYFRTHEADGLRFIFVENLKAFSTLGRAEDVRFVPEHLGDAVRIAVNLLRGLRALHGRGVVHGDIYPHNLLFNRALGPDGIRMVDLGNARPLEEHFTRRADVDVYRTALVLVGLITGHAPGWGVHQTGSREEVEACLQSIRVPELKAVLRRAVSPEPTERFPTAQALRDALRPFENVAERTPVAP